MTVRDTFVAVNDGDQLNDGYFNGSRDTLIDTTTGHDHDGTDSKAFNLVHLETQSVTNSTTVSFSGIASHAILVLRFRAIPSFSSDATKSVVLRLGDGAVDSGANYVYVNISSGTAGQISGASGIVIGNMLRASSGTDLRGCVGELYIHNAQGTAALDASVSGTGMGVSFSFLGGRYTPVAKDIDELEITMGDGEKLTGKFSLYYVVETE